MYIKYSFLVCLLLLCFFTFCKQRDYKEKRSNRIIKRESNYTCPVCPPDIVEEELIETDTNFAFKSMKIDKYYIRDGYRKELWSDGKTLVLEFYRLGIRDSIGLWFYPNGKMAHKCNFLNGREYGSTYDYIDESGQLKEYYLKNDDSAIFTVKYKKYVNGTIG